MKKIAIVTGATGGLGEEFVRRLVKEDVNEIWALARNKEKLAALRAKYGRKLRTVSADLSSESGIAEFSRMLAKEHPEVRILINNAGTGEWGRYCELSAEKASRMIDLNCKAVCLMCTAAIPFMRKGARILNISSASSFQPTPYINLYAATKAFVRSFTRALSFELKDRGIICTAVCPGWIDTAMLPKEKDGKKIKYPALVSPSRVAAQALRDSAKGREMSVCTLFVKYEHLLGKVLPDSIIMKIWMKGIKDLI